MIDGLSLIFGFAVALLVGGAAWMTGRATAIVWDSWRTLVLYAILLTLAVRFLHYAVLRRTLFGIVEATLPFVSEPGPAVRDLVLTALFVFAATAAGRMVKRRSQMARQYAGVL